MEDQYTTSILFAEEILQFLYNHSPALFGFRVQWEPKLLCLNLENNTDALCDSMFDDEIGLSVYNIITKCVKDIVGCYEDYILETEMMETVDPEKFTMYALKIAPYFFRKGYSHGMFLAYCSMVIGVAYNFLVLRRNCIPEVACQVVGLVLFSHQMTGQFHEEGSWSGLFHTACQLNKSMKASRKKRNNNKEA